MSSIIKHNRINQLGTIQLGEPKKYEDLTKEIAKVDHSKVVEEVARLNQQAKDEAEEEARRIIEQAKEEARTILEDAKKHQEELMQNTYLQIEEDKSAVEKEKEMVLQSANEQRDAIIEEARIEKRKILKEIEPEMISILKMLLTRVIDKQIVGRGQWLEWIVRKMIRTENINEDLTIYLSEASYENYAETLKSQLESYQYSIRIEMDRELSDSACAVETSTGMIYYDVKEGLQEVLYELEMLQSLSE